MRGRSLGMTVVWAVACISMAAAKPPVRSAPESVTIPLILQQAPAQKPDKPKPKPKTEEAVKSPQAIVDETKSVALQSVEPPPAPVPELPPPPAPTLAPALPTNPELFVPDIANLAPPKPAKQPKIALLPETAPPQPKPKPVTLPDVALVPETTPQPKPKPATKPFGEMSPVEDFSPGTFREGADGKPPSFQCLVRDVMAFHDRTHVRCYNKLQNRVSYFAVDTHQPVSTTVVEKALQAMQTGKPLKISFAPTTDLNPSNCGPKDCRRLIDIEN